MSILDPLGVADADSSPFCQGGKKYISVSDLPGRQMTDTGRRKLSA